MTNLSPPSLNPTNIGSLYGIMSFFLTKFLQGIDDMLPAQIISYDRTKNLAQVQPLIPMVTTDNIVIQRTPVQIVPVIQIGGGGFVLNFPIRENDLGFIKANDRDISLFIQSWTSQQPNTARKHSFEDAVFIPAVLTGFTIAGSDSNNVVLQSVDGNLRFSLGSSTCITDQISYSQNTNAILDLQSTTKAFKIPRMTHAQRDAIPSPEGGMMVYLTDYVTGFSYYTDGIGWS